MTLRSIGLPAVLPLAIGIIGCTDTPAPPYRGASYFQTITGGCNVGTASAFAIPEGQQPTTQTDQGPRIEDGKNGADVSCEVSRSGDGYFISGTLQQGTRSFTVAGTVARGESGHAGLGTVIQVDSPSSLNVRSDPDSCQLTVNANQDIGPGRVWGNFSCARVADPPNAECEAMGSFVFENCKK